MFSKNQWVKEKIKEKLKNILQQMKMKMNITIYGMQKKLC